MIDATAALNGASGVLFVLLGAWVARVGRGARGTRAFTLFATGLGVNVVVQNFFAPYEAAVPVALLVVREGALLASAGGVLLVALLFPRPLAREERPLALLAGLLVAPVAAVAFATPRVSPTFSLDAFLVASWAGVFLLALRYRRHAKDPAFRSSLALLATAIALYPAYASVSPLYGGATVGTLSRFGALLVAVLLWLRNADIGRRAPVQVAWAMLAAGLAASLIAVASGTAGDNPGRGLSRTVGVAVLAYAIVRHAVLGIDVKVRWGLSKSTVAAAFIAVFFVASEGAQILFGGENEWVGLLAAGGLVFALAPLQRAAERLAERAVPVEAPLPILAAAAAPPMAARARAGAAPAPQTHGAYKRAVRLALKGRAVTRDEEMEMAHLAEDLGIGAGTALLLRREVEEELIGGGGAT